MDLGWADPLPGRPRRVLVAGCSGSGKSTVARAIGARLGLPHQELDALFHGPGWVPRAEFERDVRRLVAGEHWVCEYQYTAVRPLLLARAELFVWLDLSRSRVFSQLVRRTVTRRVARTPLWNGNVEPPLHTVLTDPDHLLRYAWRAYPVVGRHAEAARSRDPELPVVRLRTRREVTAWLERLTPAPPNGAAPPG